MLKLKDIKNSNGIKVLKRINNDKEWSLLNVDYVGNEDRVVESGYENGDGMFLVILKREKDLRYYDEETKKELMEDYYKKIDESRLISKEEWEKMNPRYIPFEVVE